MKAPNKHTIRQSGLGLPEILVGLAIGLVTTLVITQVMTTFEGQKRTTSGTADAQTSGSIALYTVQRQAQAAGFGLPVFSEQNQPLNCDPMPTFHDTGPSPSPDINNIFPVTIADGGSGAGASDVITLRRGSSTMAGIPITVSTVDAGAKSVGVSNNLGCQTGDIALVMKGSACVMTKVTGTASTNQITLQSVAGIGSGYGLSCLGSTWMETQYRVQNNTLMENDRPKVAGIVNIQAQYGIADVPGDNRVTAWVDASGTTWASPGAADRNRIKAVRIAVVARSGLLEKENVSKACSSVTAAAPDGVCAWEGSSDNPAPAIDLSKNADGTANPDWQKYRYRVFETIIPLRNMIWSKDRL